jgi:predicted NAD/FAD-binding protein
MKQARQHIVIIGGNFAGLTAAVKLSKRHAVTVIDPYAHVPTMHR